MGEILRGEGVTKKFGGVVALKNVDFEVDRNKITGLIGPNGSGKTTLFNVICGIYPATSGKIWLDGEEITHLRPHEICKRGISRTFQVPRPFSHMTVLENVIVAVLFNRNITREASEELAEGYLRDVGIIHKKDALASELSQGERRMVEIARALATDPKMLLVDEIAAGLSPAAAEEAIDLVKSIQAKGVVVFLVEHVLRAVMSVSDKIMVLDRGEKIAEGSPDEIVENRRVLDAYLGGRYIY